MRVTTSGPLISASIDLRVAAAAAGAGVAEATSDTLILVKAVTSGARKVWRDG